MWVKIQKPIVYAWHHFWNLDTTAAQAIVGLSSLLWAFMLFMPGDTLTRPTYEIMVQIANEHTWATLFLLSGVTGFLTGLKIRYCPMWAEFIFNGITAVLWVTSAVAMVAAISPLPAAVAPHVVVALTAVWTMIRTQCPIFKRRTTDYLDEKNQ